MLTLIDNYDSFTYNLFHFLGELGAPVRVHRNDEITADEALAHDAGGDRAVARPCDPNRAGICLELIAGRGRNADPRRLPRPSGHRPGLWRPGRARAEPMHGKLSRIHHTGKRVFRGLNNDFLATRYHSPRPSSRKPAGCLEVTAETDGRRDPGRDAQAPSRAWRAVPSREHRLGERPRAPRQLPDLARSERAELGPPETIGSL